MKPHRKWPTLLALLILAMPVFAASAGPKKWFHRNHNGSSHNSGNHIVVKHGVPKHPKAEHVRNSRPQ